MVSDETPDHNTAGPSSHGDRRDPETGRLLPGHAINRGRESPDARKAVLWRHAFKSAVTPEDITAVVLKLVQAAKDGEQWAVRDLLDRTVGPSGKAAVELHMAETQADRDRKRIVIIADRGNGWGERVEPSPVSGESIETGEYIDLIDPAELAQGEPAGEPEAPAEDSQRTTKPQGENVSADDGETYDSDQPDRAADRAAQPPESGDSDAPDEPDDEGPAPDPFEGLTDAERRFVDPGFEPPNPDHGDPTP